MEIFTTPYYLLNLRQFFKDRKAFFVILARTKEDVSSAVQFASKHNLALSVFSTGHEFQGKDLFDRRIYPSHLTLHADVLKIKTIIVVNQKFAKMPFVYYLQIHFWLLCSLDVLAAGWPDYGFINL